MSNVCRAYGEVCEYATEYGYCRLTACAKRPQTITTNFTTSIIDTNNDVVEVVRCKDCKFWVEDGNESFGYAMFCEHDCSLGGQGIKKPDDYCSYGEREEQEHE